MNDLDLITFHECTGARLCVIWLYELYMKGKIGDKSYIHTIVRTNLSSTPQLQVQYIYRLAGNLHYMGKGLSKLFLTSTQPWWHFWRTGRKLGSYMIRFSIKTISHIMMIPNQSINSLHLERRHCSNLFLLYVWLYSVFPIFPCIYSSYNYIHTTVLEGLLLYVT